MFTKFAPKVGAWPDDFTPFCVRVFRSLEEVTFCFGWGSRFIPGGAEEHNQNTQQTYEQFRQQTQNINADEKTNYIKT